MSAGDRTPSKDLVDANGHAPAASDRRDALRRVPAVDALLVRPASAKAIKDAVFRLRDDPGLAIQLSAAARRRVKQHFTWSRAQRELVQAYQEVLGRSPDSSSRKAAVSPVG